MKLRPKRPGQPEPCPRSTRSTCDCLRRFPETEGHVSNTAKGGAEASALTLQAASALARVPAPRLAIVQTLDNDIRCDESNVAAVAASLEDAFRAVHDASPNTVILVLKQPGRPSVAFVQRIVEADPTQAQALTSDDDCSYFAANGKIQRDGNPEAELRHRHVRGGDGSGVPSRRELL